MKGSSLGALISLGLVNRIVVFMVTDASIE